MIWLISDTHFGHKNIGKYCNRPSGWEKKIIDSWNELVQPKDYVVHLGDFALTRRDIEKMICGGLNGVKILIPGNHDGGVKRMLDIGFSRVVRPPDVAVLQDEDMGKVAVASIAGASDCRIEGDYDHILFVSHVPIRKKLHNRDKHPYFYGHIHNDESDTSVTPGIEGHNMSVDVNEFRPRSLKELL